LRMMRSAVAVLLKSARIHTEVRTARPLIMDPGLWLLPTSPASALTGALCVPERIFMRVRDI
jgi:hypothetical protein